MSGPRTAPAGLEVAAFLLVPAAAWGFVRIFETPDDVVPVVGAALASAGLAILVRRAGLGLIVSALVSLAAVAALVVRRFAPGTGRLGVIPDGDTLTVLRELGRAGAEEFSSVRAPVEATDPFLAAAMVATWVMAWLTDWGANRLRLAFEPVLPAGLLFAFSSILGSGAYRRSSTVLFLGAVMIWALTQRHVGLSRHEVWLAEDRRRGLAAVTRSGVAVALVASLLGLTLGARLPGADANELIEWRTTTEGPRRVVSPFVNLSERLVSNDDSVLFRVTADQPSYWRLAGLDTIEGDAWTITDDFVVSEGVLPGELPRLGATKTVTQRFEIVNLAEIWLPAAYAPAVLSDANVEATWNSETASLTVSQESDDSDGATYRVESVVPVYSAAELAAAPTDVPSEIAERYLALPDDLSPEVARQAEAVTAGATSRYEQMLRLQDWFRTFDYSLDLGPRGDDPVETFLDERVGFCQQFSGTFALMARQLGAPARVAVGFTWGDPVDTASSDETASLDESASLDGTAPLDGATTYEITSRHTHAWPEVWFEGLGWVAFEPTPTRGAPDAGYTNLSPRQDSLVDPVTDDATTPTTAPALPSDPTTVPSFLDPAPVDADGGSLVATDDGGISVPWPVPAVLGVAAAWAVGVPALRAARWRRRRDRAVGPLERIEVAWAEAIEELGGGFGLRRRPTETRAEFASRTIDDRRLPVGVLGELAALSTASRYRPAVAAAAGGGDGGSAPEAPLSPDEVSAARADELSELLVQRVKDRSPRTRRLRRALDPRTAVR